MAAELKLQDRPATELRDMSLVEVAHAVLLETKEPFYYRDLMNQVAALRQMSREEVEDAIARLYTDINIDGRFLCIGDNVWGLKRWYPLERATERGSSKRFVRKDVVHDAEDDDGEDDDSEIDETELLDEEPPFAFEEDEEEVLEEEALVEEELEFLEEEEDDSEELADDDDE
ncbi:MAG: DNA-directed RNA polymerase subunit delta [Bacilli bacterium]